MLRRRSLRNRHRSLRKERVSSTRRKESSEWNFKRLQKITTSSSLLSRVRCVNSATIARTLKILISRTRFSKSLRREATKSTRLAMIKKSS